MASLAPDLTVTLTDGTRYEVHNSMADTLAWEKYALANGLEVMGATITMIVFYAWRGARKQGISAGEDLEVFAERIDEFDIDEAEAPDPTRPGRGDG